MPWPSSIMISPAGNIYAAQCRRDDHVIDCCGELLEIFGRLVYDYLILSKFRCPARHNEVTNLGSDIHRRGPSTKELPNTWYIGMR